MLLLTPPTVQPVSIDEAATALRIDDHRFDTRLPASLGAARALAEQETGRLFMTQTWRTEMDTWPAASDILRVHRATAAAISYWDGSTWATLSPAEYVVAPNGNGTSVAPAIGSSWPALGDVALGPRVRIDLTAGTADASNVPEGVKHYIIALTGQLIQSPDLSAASAGQHPLLARLLHPWRLYT